MNIFGELERDWHHLASRLHHHDGRQAAATITDQGETMNLTEIHNIVEEGIGNIKGWAANLEEKLPEIAAKAAQVDQSPIVQALEGIVLPPAVEAEIASLIAKLGAEFPAQQAAPAAPEPVQPEQPAEGQQPAEAQPAAG